MRHRLLSLVFLVALTDRSSRGPRFCTENWGQKPGDNDSLFPVAFQTVRRGYEAKRRCWRMISAAGYHPEAFVRYIDKTQSVDSREFRIAALENAISRSSVKSVLSSFC
jgi:hypothetical protein